MTQSTTYKNITQSCVQFFSGVILTSRRMWRVCVCVCALYIIQIVSCKNYLWFEKELLFLFSSFMCHTQAAIQVIAYSINFFKLHVGFFNDNFFFVVWICLIVQKFTIWRAGADHWPALMLFAHKTNSAQLKLVSSLMIGYDPHWKAL